jgi:hypothetical protein
MPNVCGGYRSLTIQHGLVVALSLCRIGTATQRCGYNAALRSYEMVSRLTASEVKVDCGKDTNWLLFRSAQLQRFSQ